MPSPRSLITRTLPTPLFRVAGRANPYQDYLNSYDFAIGGIPFRADSSPESPLIRSSAQFRKDQFDNGTEPGEQSLAGWWLRSQSSWHLGTGIVNSDVRLDESAEFRFADSEGIDCWTRGEISLLPAAYYCCSAGPNALCIGAWGGEDGLLFADDDYLEFHSHGDFDDEIVWGGAPGLILSIASDGQRWYAASTDGIYSGALVGDRTGVKLWSISASRVLLAWCKGRLMAAVDHRLYELVPPITAAPHALPTTPVYTHPATGWTWTGISDGPAAIYAIGSSGAESTILSMTLATTGALPALVLATTAAELPRGEAGTALYTYLGRYLCIGTSRGVRIAQIGPQGDIEYGPLIATPRSVRDFVAVDHFVYAGLSRGFAAGTSGLLRIDLAEPLGSGRYPSAKDLDSRFIGTVTAVTTMGAGGELAFVVAGDGLYHQADYFESSGWMDTGRVRFNTLWPKLFKFVRVKASNLVAGAAIGVSSIDEVGNITLLASVSSGARADEDLPINVPSAPQEYIQLRFTLSSGDDDEQSPIMRGYQVKALPGGPRPRRIVIPLRCYDSELDSAGVHSGYPGFGLERLEAVEALDSAGEVVLFEDLQNNTAITATIEQIEYRQVVPPVGDEVWGGVLTVELRTLV